MKHAQNYGKKTNDLLEKPNDPFEDKEIFRRLPETAGEELSTYVKAVIFQLRSYAMNSIIAYAIF